MQRHLLSALALVILALSCAGEAGALVQRTFVSGLGSDANPCTRTAPCRTFAAAIDQTLAGGEVIALDSAGYGPVTITKAISLISPPGVYAGITTTVPSTNAITITAGANDVVVLKGLSLTGLGVGFVGIAFSSGKALRVEDLTVTGFTDNGLMFAPSATARMTVVDSLFRDNGQAGIWVQASSEKARVGVDGSRFIGNVYGLVAAFNSQVSVRDSVASGNAVGIWASHETSVVTVENCLATDGNEGITSWGVVRVAGSTMTDNVFGVATAFGGSIFSRGNNTVEANTIDGTFTGLFAAK